uniref:polyribonucleotide nucleotidyltransferase n=1 Tax=Meloidogyne incognita TaxID=6306 RepID=A0A914MZA9_MELIC
MQRAQAKHAKILFHRLHDQASTSNSNYLRYIQNRTNNTSASFNGSISENKNIPEHSEYAHLSGGRRWELRAGAMARLASGSVVLNTDEDNAILGTVVCKYTQKFLNEEEILEEIEENERLELNKNKEVDEEFEESEILEKNESEYGIGEITTDQINEKKIEKNKKVENDSNLTGLPLTVDFRPSSSALGRIPMNYFRRDMYNNDQDVAFSRVIDRSIRPTIPENFPHKTQIVCKPLALDTETGDAVIMGINVASAALAVSPVPQNCLVAAARIGIIDEKIIVNPSHEQLKHSSLDVVLTGTSIGKKSKGNNDYVIMVEMEGKEVEAEKFVQCIQQGFDEIRLTQGAIERLAKVVGQEKYKTSPNEFSADLLEKVSVCEGAIEAILKEHSHSKSSRGEAIENIFQGWRLLMDRQSQTYSEQILRNVFGDITKKVHRNILLETGTRIDGRKSDQFRPIKCKVNLYRKLHGSAIFQRGQSQVFSTVTFDSPQAAFHPDAIAQLLGAQRKKSFMLHYEFPQFATNEIEKPGGSSDRREIGHGLLAEKSLRNLVPEDFPYTIRLACQVLESNGSTSMASVCAGSMALFDAGVPLLSNHVAGLALGLITEKSENAQINNEIDKNESGSNSPKNRFPNKYLLLTDLAGFEDFAGDMDFKIAGTSKGFTAMQMDLKICGIPLKVFREALKRGQSGIEHVLSLMRAEIPEPRPEMKSSVPIIELMQLPIYKRPILFRSGAYNAKLIEAETGVKVSSEDDANIQLFAPNPESLDKAKLMIEKLMVEQQEEQYQFGAFYKAEIVRILEGGIHVSLKEGGRHIWIRNSDLSSAPSRQNAQALGFEVGHKLTVQYFGRDQHTGQHRLTRKTLQMFDPPVQNLFKEKQPLNEKSLNEKIQKETKSKNIRGK